VNQRKRPSALITGGRFSICTARATPDSGVSINDSARPVILASAWLGYAPVIQTTEGKPE
jgi:hypothetical protein